MKACQAGDDGVRKFTPLGWLALGQAQSPSLASLDNGKADTRQARVEVLDPVERPPRQRGRVVIVVLGPAHETPVEGVS